MTQPHAPKRHNSQRYRSPSRRKFLKLAGQSTAAGLAGLSGLSGLLGAGALSSSTAVAKNRTPDVLGFRVGAPLLQLHYNENSLGMSPLALEAAKKAIVDYGNRYADVLANRLKASIAELHGVDESQVILGNGSTEVIGAIVTLAAQRNSTVIEPAPTFGDVRSRAKGYNMSVVSVPVGKGFVTDINALKKKSESIKGPQLINICNPNNPTGTIVDQTALTDWIDGAPNHHLFLIDEAYFAYAHKQSGYSSAVSLIQNGTENVVITRTFSKVYGMAGMRIGYGIAAPKTAAALDQFAVSHNVSAAGSAAAIASLEDSAFYTRSLASNAKSKAMLVNALQELRLAHIDSHTNFVLHKIDSNLADYSRRMQQNGVRVGRRMTQDDGWNRLSMGKPEEMAEFIRVLKAFRQRQWV